MLPVPIINLTGSEVVCTDDGAFAKVIDAGLADPAHQQISLMPGTRMAFLYPMPIYTNIRQIQKEPIP